HSSSSSSSDDLAGLLGPGVVSLGQGGNVGFADSRALTLLGCADASDLQRLWEQLAPRLASAGLSGNGAGGGSHWAALDLPRVEGLAAAEETGAQDRRVLFDLRRDPQGGGILLVQDLGTLAGLETDLRLTSQMRSVAQISPAVAHDL